MTNEQLSLHWTNLLSEESSHLYICTFAHLHWWMKLLAIAALTVANLAPWRRPAKTSKNLCIISRAVQFTFQNKSCHEKHGHSLDVEISIESVS